MYDPFQSFKKAVLPNGLTLYHAQHDKPFFHCYATVHVGSREDYPGKEGIAHLLEHLVSRNCSKHPSYLENRRFFTGTGGWVDFGATGFFSTQYSFFLPANAADVKKGLDVFGSMLVGSPVRSKLDEQKSVIYEEYSRSFADDKIHYLSRISYKLALGEAHRLGHSTNLGTPETVKGTTYEDLERFRRQYYVPANISIVTAGPVALKDVEAMLLETDFAKPVPGERNPIPAPMDIPKPLQNYLEESLAKHFAMKSRQTTYDKTWVLPPTNPEAVSFLSRTLNQALFDEIREKRSLAYSFSASFTNYQSFILFYIGGEVAAERAKEIDPVVQEIMGQEELLKKGFEEAKDRRLKGLALYDASIEKYVEDATGDVEAEQRIVTNTEVFERCKAVEWEDVRKLLKELTPEKAVLYLEMP